MARISLFQSAALAVLAVAGAMAVPAQAQDQDRSGAQAEARQARQEARAERQEARQYRAVAQAAEARQAPVARDWSRGDGGGQARAEARQPQRSAPEGGWRSQRPAEGQRYGRNWDNGGTVSRPAPAWRGATPQVPERGSAERTRRYDGARASGDWQRNRTYSDPARSGSYGGDHERTAETWRTRQGDRDRTTTYRNGYRDGRTADSYRDRRDQRYAYRQGYTSGSRDYRRWDRSDWRRDTRYNWYGYRTQHRDLYRAGRYYPPYRNWSYNRLSIGLFLEPLFYGNRYWIDDPWQYRLPAVYGPYRWVRYYDDVLLVDIYTGEVVDVIHDFFW